MNLFGVVMKVGVVGFVFMLAWVVFELIKLGIDFFIETYFPKYGRWHH